MSDFGSDPWLDARLRNVPLPVEMLRQLQGIPAIEETALDDLDVALNDVPVPEGLLTRLHLICHQRSRASLGRRSALAASLLIAFGVGALAWSRRGEQVAQAPVPPIERVAIDDEAPLESANAVEDLSPEDLEADAIRQKLLAAAGWAAYDPDVVFDPAAFTPQLNLPTPTTRIDKSSIFTTDGALDRLPDMALAAEVGPRGWVAPAERGYDAVFAARHGEHPFVAPASNKKLASLTLPLNASTASFDSAWRAVAAGKLPAGDAIAIEHFVAAVEPGFAKPADGAVGLRVAAGPSPLSPQTTLLQVGVQAGRCVIANGSATELVIVVDNSASMRWDGRLARARWAVAELAGRLSPQDRVSLVASSDDAVVLAERIAAGEAAKLVDAAQSLQVSDATNLGRGLERAFAAFDGSTANRRVVLITDGLATLSPAARTRLIDLAKEQHQRGTQLSICEVGNGLNGDEREMLSAVAAAGGGTFAETSDAKSVYYQLLGALRGDAVRVADEVTVTVRFNPQAVASYRLVGHAPVSLGGTAAATAITLRDGEAASTLLEIVPAVSGGDEFATVDLSYRASDGQLHQATQNVSRLQIARTFAEAPISLQRAAIAARLAAVLGESYFVTPAQANWLSGKGFDTVEELAALASPRALEHPSVRACVSLADAAGRVRRGR